MLLDCLSRQGFHAHGVDLGLGGVEFEADGSCRRPEVAERCNHTEGISSELHIIVAGTDGDARVTFPDAEQGGL